MTGSIKRPDITEVGSSALILKRFERSEAFNGWNDLNPAMLPHSGRMRLPSSTGEAFPMETGEKCVV
jgi:hypothetical protein